MVTNPDRDYLFNRQWKKAKLDFDHDQQERWTRHDIPNQGEQRYCSDTHRKRGKLKNILIGYPSVYVKIL